MRRLLGTPPNAQNRHKAGFKDGGSKWELVGLPGGRGTLWAGNDGMRARPAPGSLGFPSSAHECCLGLLQDPHRSGQCRVGPKGSVSRQRS